MADAHDLGYGRHGQAALVGGSDGVIALPAEIIASPLQGFLALRVALGKGRETFAGIGSLALWSGDALIV